MGFKEIEKFNDTLLAKQVWRMINNSESLCHRVFKAQFFPDCSILDAKESRLGSKHGRVLLGLEMWYTKGWFGALGQERLFELRRIGGCLDGQIVQSFHPFLLWIRM